MRRPGYSRSRVSGRWSCEHATETRLGLAHDRWPGAMVRRGSDRVSPTNQGWAVVFVASGLIVSCVAAASGWGPWRTFVVLLGLALFTGVVIRSLVAT